MKRLRAISGALLMLVLSAILLVACGGDSPTATPAATATTAAAPTATRSGGGSATATTGTRPAPTATRGTGTAPTATTGRRAATATTATNSGGDGRLATTDEENALDEALGKLDDLKTYRFRIVLEPSTFITRPVEAEGDYEAPDTVYIKGELDNEEFENIVVGDTVFVKDANGDYVVQEEREVDPNDPTASFQGESLISSGNPLSGIGDFAEGASDIRYVGDVQIGGETVKHFVFKLDIEKMMGEDGAQGMDLSGLDLGGGGFYLNEDEAQIYGIEYNLNVGAFFELLARAFSGMMGTPTPGGPSPTPLPRMDVNMLMEITRHNDPSISVPVTDEMREIADGGTDEPTEEPTDEPTPGTDETPEAFPTVPGLPSGDGITREGNVGDVVNVGWAKITINSVERNLSGFIDPDEGKEYVGLNLTIENVSSDEPQNFSSLLMFKMLYGDGTEAEQSLYAEQDNPIDSETPNPLEKGDSITGDVAFQVNEGSTDLTLQFFPYPFFDEETKAEIALNN